MGREHPPETVSRAQELYCLNRLTFAQVAEAVGVAESTLKRWSETLGWQAKRAEIAKAEADMRADLILARAKMIKALSDTKDPQTAYAVASLEGLAMKQAEHVRQGRQMEGQPSATRPLREIRTEADMVAALEEALQIRMGRILDDPSLVDLKTVRELQQAMELVQGMRRGAAKAARQRGLTPETTNAMRRQILGVE